MVNSTEAVLVLQSMAKLDTVLYLLDMVGIVACAMAGTVLAMNKGFDFFGCILVSMVNAIGGGTLRDLILARQPLFWTQDLSYLFVISLTSLLGQIFINHSHKIDGTLKLFDAVGLAAFSVIGFNVALSLAMPYPVAVLLAVLTSIAGGIMRDMICNEIPLVLQKEIYISACIIGCFAHQAAGLLHLAASVQDAVMLLVVFMTRLLALRFDWHLPSLGGRF